MGETSLNPDLSDLSLSQPPRIEILYRMFASFNRWS